MALEHNERSGFLIGERITGEIERMADEMRLLRGIEKNTRQAVSLLRRMSTMPAPADPGQSKIAPVQNLVRQAANDEQAKTRGTQEKANPPADVRSGRGAATPADQRQQAKPSNPGEPKQKAPAAANSQAKADSANVATRDNSGRFVSVSGSSPSSAKPSQIGGAAGGAIGAMADAVKEAVSSVGSGSDNIDPTIQAAKELGGIFAPAKALFKPLGGLFGRGKEAKEAKKHREEINWLRRIWRAQTDAGKQGGGGLMRVLAMLAPLLAMLLAPLKMMKGLLGAMKLGSLAGLGRLGGLGRRRGSRYDAPRGHGGGSVDAGGRGRQRPGAPGSPGESKKARGGKLAKLGGVGKSLMGSLATGGKALLKRIPILGALIGGGMLASDLMKDAKTPEEKQSKWGSVGGTAGGLIGGAIGLLGGPAGAIAGGMLGDYIGEKVGTWLATADLGSMISDVQGLFSKIADTTKDLAGSAFDYIQKAWSGLIDTGSKLFTKFGDWINEKWEGAKEWAGDKVDTVQDVAYSARDKVSAGASSIADSGRNLLSTVTGGRYTGGSNAAKGEMISAMAEAGITDPNSQAALMANVDNETGGFKRFDENLNYSSKRLQEIFPKYYKNADDARADAGNPEAIANRVYGGRMGNKDPGDGYKYRGRGMIQLTGKDQYESMGKKLGIDLVNNPDLAADPKYASKIAATFWKTSGADKAAAAGDHVKARRIVNGGSIGLKEVQEKTPEYLKQAMAGELTPAQTADKTKAAAPEPAQKAMASTMATLKGSTQPIGVLAPASSAAKAPAPSAGGFAPAEPKAASIAPAAQPAAASTATAPAMGSVATAAPALIAPLAAPPAVSSTAQAVSYAPPAPNASLVRVPETPEVRTPPGSSAPAKQSTPAAQPPLSQNMADRQIAHVAAGGIGMGMGMARV